MNYRSVLIATLQTIVLFASGLVIPLLGQMLALITPVPLILVYIRNGRKEGLASLAGATLLVAALIGWQAAAILVFSFGLMAVGLSEGIRRAMKPEQATLLGGMLPLAVIAAIVVFYILRIGKSPLDAVEEYLRESITAAGAVYTKMGLTEVAAAVASVEEKVIYYLARLMPAITIATSLLQSATCYGISRAILTRRAGAAQIPPQPSLAQWHAPDVWVWGMIAGLVCIIMPNPAAKLVGWNFAIIFGIVYLAQGIAIVEFYLRKVRLSSFMRGLIHALIIALPTIVFVIALGIVDIWADVRKVREGVPHP